MSSAEPFVSPTAYLPPLSWLAAARRCGGWLVEGHENYQKRSWRNRCRIVGANGPQTLTVPLVKGKNRQTPIREVRISYDEDWVRDHRRAIRAAYGRAPFFEHYAAGIFDVLGCRPPTLWELNHDLLSHLLERVGFPVRPRVTTTFRGPYPTDLGDPVAPYPQVFEDRHGFVGGMSVLDGLFCLGPAL